MVTAYFSCQSNEADLGISLFSSNFGTSIDIVGDGLKPTFLEYRPRSFWTFQRKKLSKSISVIGLISETLRFWESKKLAIFLVMLPILRSRGFSGHTILWVCGIHFQCSSVEDGEKRVTSNNAYPSLQRTLHWEVSESLEIPPNL